MVIGSLLPSCGANVVRSNSGIGAGGAFWDSLADGARVNCMSVKLSPELIPSGAVVVGGLVMSKRLGSELSVLTAAG